MKRASLCRQCGLSLIELIVFIVIVSVGIAGILSVINIAGKGSADPMIRKQVLSVAEAMMEEVLSKDFSDPYPDAFPAVPGNPAQAERPNFSCVGDYHMTGGWKWTGVRSLVDTSTNIAGLENYTVAITVEEMALNGLASAKSKRVTVAVSGGNETITLVGYRTKYED